MKTSLHFLNYFRVSLVEDVHLNLTDCELYGDSTPEVQNVSKFNNPNKSFPSRSNYAP